MYFWVFLQSTQCGTDELKEYSFPGEPATRQVGGITWAAEDNVRGGGFGGGATKNHRQSGCEAPLQPPAPGSPASNIQLAQQLGQAACPGISPALLGELAWIITKRLLRAESL